VTAQILAFPCNQFGGLEPGGSADIKAAVRSTYNATFPLFSKVTTPLVHSCAQTHFKD
jgi:glutathione peroxidase-family protein